MGVVAWCDDEDRQRDAAGGPVHVVGEHALRSRGRVEAGGSNRLVADCNLAARLRLRFVDVGSDERSQVTAGLDEAERRLRIRAPVAGPRRIGTRMRDRAAQPMPRASGNAWASSAARRNAPAVKGQDRESTATTAGASGQEMDPKDMVTPSWRVDGPWRCRADRWLRAWPRRGRCGGVRCVARAERRSPTPLRGELAGTTGDGSQHSVRGLGGRRGHVGVRNGKSTVVNEAVRGRPSTGLRAWLELARLKACSSEAVRGSIMAARASVRGPERTCRRRSLRERGEGQGLQAFFWAARRPCR